MSKPIKVTEALIQSALAEFSDSLRKMKMFDGKINYTKSFKWEEDEKATVVFSPVAFAKMTMLVQKFDSEVAWHGVAYRDEDKKDRFFITDILVYPQLVSGTTVNTDQEKYQNWLYAQEDEVFNNIRMQGHSHVNFPTSPSGVDTTHQEKILEQLDDDMFYIFMIWNKKFERTIKIYDLENNTLYENEDVNVSIDGAGVDLDAFIKEAKQLVVTKGYQPAGVSYNSPQYNKPALVDSKAKDSPKEKPKEKAKEKPAIGRVYDNFDDPAGYWGGNSSYSRYYR